MYISRPLTISAICQPQYFTEWKYVHAQAISRLVLSVKHSILQSESMYMPAVSPLAPYVNHSIVPSESMNMPSCLTISAICQPQYFIGWK
jgi:hypothetical protein